MSLALTIPIHHPAFAGHFPGMPIVPGVVLLDETIREIALAEQLSPDHCTISVVKFLSPLRPGESLVLDYQRNAESVISFTLSSGQRTIASGKFTFAAIPV